MPACWKPARGAAPVAAVLFTLVVLVAGGFAARAAVIRDGGINPANLGKGTWIYILPNAINQLGGTVPAVTNLPSLMAFFTTRSIDPSRRSLAWRSSVQRQKDREFSGVTAGRSGSRSFAADPSRRKMVIPSLSFSRASSAVTHSWSEVIPAPI